MKRLLVVLLMALFAVAACASDKEKAANFVKEGKTFFENKEYPKAVIQLKNAVKLDPESEEAYRLLAQSYLMQKNAQEAFAAFLRLEQIAPEDLETKIQVASFYLLAQQRIEAEKRIEAVLEKTPTDVKALYLKAGLLGAQKEDMGAIKAVYEKILEINAREVRAMLILAQISQSQGEAERAEALLKEAVKTAPDDLGTHRALFGYYVAGKKIDQARTVLEHLVEIKPTEVEPRIMLANFYTGLHQNELAEQTYLKAVELAPDNPLPHMLIARFYNGLEMPDKAEGFIQKALAIDPDHHGLKTVYGEFHFLHQAFDKAEELADEVLAERPDFPQAKLLKAKVLAVQKKTDPAIEILQTLLKDEPDSPEYNFFIGSLFLEKEKVDQGLAHLAKALEKNPRHFKALLMKADVHFRKGDYALAESELAKALALRPGDYGARLLRAGIHAVKKETKEAEALLTQLITDHPANPAAYFRLGNLKAEANQLDAALADYEKALAINPNLMDVFTNIIRIHATKKEFEKGLARCDAHLKAIREENPVVVSIIFNLKGGLYLAMKDLAQAKQAFAAAIEKNPKFISPYLSLAGIHAGEKNPDQQLETYKALLAERPDQSSIHAQIGTIYEAQGQGELAESHYKKALELNPDHIPAMNNLAFLYAEQDREMNRALDLARKARELGGEVPAIMDTLGWVYYKKALYDSAIEEFSLCVKKEPENPIFHFHLGLAYNKKWDYANAKKSLTRALELQEDFKGADEARKILAQI